MCKPTVKEGCKPRLPCKDVVRYAKLNTVPIYSLQSHKIQLTVHHTVLAVFPQMLPHTSLGNTGNRTSAVVDL